MTDQNDKNQHTGVNPAAAAATGAVVGAGLAVAGVVALKDKHNREKVKEAFSMVKDQAVEYVQKVANDKKDDIKHGIAQGKHTMNAIKSTAKKATHTK